MTVISHLYITDKKEYGFLLGFAAYATRELERGVRALVQLFTALKRQ